MSMPAVDPSPSHPDSPCPEAPPEQHLIVVSNRLPITITKDAQGEYHFKMSSGGLVSALSGTKKSMSFIWIGWPGFYIPPKDRSIVDKRLMEEYSCQAVYLDDDVADRHYNGFSNSILWPLFHPMLLRGLVTGPELTREFTSNELANITQDIESEDYPLDGRETVKGVKIGFFLHTPFPSSEIYRLVVCHRACPTAYAPVGTRTRLFVSLSSL